MKTKILIAIAFIAFVALGISSITKTDNKLKLKDIQLKSTKTDLIEVEAERDLLNKKFEDILKSKKIDEAEFKKLQEENKALQEREAELRKQVKAKEAQKLAEAQKLQQAASMTVKAYAATGGCAEWMSAAGIPQTEATTKLILKESGCNPRAVNPSSGACGIPQAYPCSKLPQGVNTDPVTQLQWMQSYVTGRYGSWENALSTWYSRCGSPQGCWY